MDRLPFKAVITARGYTYGYYSTKSQADPEKPAVVFLHGFPCTSHDWEPQLELCYRLGYAAIIPDLLGYGHTSKPKDANEYKLPDIAHDVVNILDAEGIEQAIFVGHDWGSALASRIWSVHPERVIALAFLAVGYTPPQTEKLDYEKRLKELNQHLGTELYGYWEYFGSHDGWKMLEKNIESFYDLFFAGDPMQARDEISPRGRAQAWIEGDRRVERAYFWDAATRRKHQKRLLEGGLQGPCNWYRMRLLDLGLQSEAKIPKINHRITVPTFLGAPIRDRICLAELTMSVLPLYVDEDLMTIKEFDCSHWMMIEAPEELNKALEQFFHSVELI